MRLLRASVPIACMVLMAGCAGTKVADVQTRPSAADLPMPRSIALVIEDDSAVSKHDTAEEHAADVQKAVTDLMAGLTDQLTQRHLTVVSAGQAADLQLRCQIHAVRSGSEALRVAVGYGAGKAVLETTETLSDLRTLPPVTLLSFDARSTTGGMPGPGLGLANAANGAAVALGAVGTARTLRQGLPKEINETTEKIDEEIGKYFGEQKWRYGDPPKS